MQHLLQDILSACKANKSPIAVAGALGIGKAYLALLCSHIRPVIWVSKNQEAMEQDARDFRFLFGSQVHSKLLCLPAREQTPYHAASENPSLTMERLAALHALSLSQPFSVLVTCPEALISYSIPFSSFQSMTQMVELGTEIDRASLLQNLHQWGYTKVPVVEDAGTYAIRGSIVDLFWPGLQNPVRIDFFGHTVERLHTFHPEGQRLIQPLQHIAFGPVRDVVLSPASLELAEERLRNLADELNYPTKSLRDKLHDLQQGIPFFGVENLLPAFYETLQTPFEIIEKAFGQNSITILLDEPDAIAHTAESLHQTYEEQHAIALAKQELCFSKESHLLKPDALFQQLKRHFSIKCLGTFQTEKPDWTLEYEQTASLRQDILKETIRTDSTHLEDDAHHLLKPLVTLIQEQKKKGNVVLLPTSALSGVHRLVELLGFHHLRVDVLKNLPNWHDDAQLKALHHPAIHAYAFVAQPELPYHGGTFPEFRVCFITEEEIFGHRLRKAKQVKGKGFRTTLGDLEPGDYVVHIDHGVGLFKGLTKLNLQGVEQDYILLVYANDDKLYLPVYRINCLQKYANAESETARLDKLGGTAWQSKKAKVKQAVVAMAQDLLHLYAKRELVKRTVFFAPSEAYFEFEAHFPFETTPDQQKAIDDVIADMQKERPMDRLICGDVGYGKTEVAMRAAMLAVLSQKQVAVLAPTTVLAQQHYMTFTERFKQVGVRIAVVSRFQKPKEINQILKQTKEGKIDILIGTHRLLSDDVHFSNLGLAIIDEEQRFGIKAKEHMKRLRTHVDVLTLSATPIPRTLQMGFFGLRDLSIIETPPVDRRSIRTQVVRFDDEIIREAILLELKRTGQVYFVHNRVSSIQARADYLRRLIPEAKIEVGHGQMDEDQLEQVMMRFIGHEFHVLVCTTIIETGIDVPSANTMLIDHADDFGLAQLYQLRGRVGRSKERAFAYLLIPNSTETLTPIAKKRLEILNRFSELGAGFRIAQHDLELRGAGDLLGKAQHGHMASVGYDLYSDLLKEAVEDLKGKGHHTVPDPEVHVPVSALIPDSYVADMHDRLSYYQRLAVADDQNEIWNVIGLIQDQYGEAPQEVEALAEVMILKGKLRHLRALGLEIQKGISDIDPPKIVVSLGESPKLDGAKLLEFVKQQPATSLSPKMKLFYTPNPEDWAFKDNKNYFQCAKRLLDMISKIS